MNTNADNLMDSINNVSIYARRLADDLEIKQNQIDQLLENASKPQSPSNPRQLPVWALNDEPQASLADERVIQVRLAESSPMVFDLDLFWQHMNDPVRGVPKDWSGKILIDNEGSWADALWGRDGQRGYLLDQAIEMGKSLIMDIRSDQGRPNADIAFYNVLHKEAALPLAELCDFIPINCYMERWLDDDFVKQQIHEALDIQTQVLDLVVDKSYPIVAMISDIVMTPTVRLADPLAFFRRCKLCNSLGADVIFPWMSRWLWQEYWMMLFPNIPIIEDIDSIHNLSTTAFMALARVAGGAG